MLPRQVHIVNIALVYSISVNLGALGEVASLGCLKVANGGDEFQTLAKDYSADKLDVQGCVFKCWTLRFTYAALQKGFLCFCGMTARETIKVADDECDSRCNGNCRQACGGEHAISVYKTGYIREPIIAIDQRDLYKAKIGCYDKTSSGKILCPKDFAPIRTVRMSVPLCLYYCDSIYSAKFGTLSADDRCCCSNSVFGAKNTMLSWCDIPCAADDSVGCIGAKNRGTQWATFEIARIANFKRWPKSMFLEAHWIEPQFPVSDKFEIDKKSDRDTVYGSLSGLLAKKRARKPGDEEGEDTDNANSIDKEVQSLVGGDKRQPAIGSVQDSVAILEVPGSDSKETPEPGVESSTVIILVSVVLAFLVFTMAFTCYVYKVFHVG
ncbi:uncharacterized protein LOC106064771 isoform X1 [Biomphalaria glabrata]|uniref:Uncharacterized protein LOC106064771 isoform X1 n=1 Tax=Biomphalaria glabrata TaxID=6526 RepID=A0A9W2ZWK3_BIOGL|nr:uncharacterized protein LOC106064771 isoform X1 [Biomphalaria glabrata]